jgi:hypothetical protein
MEIITPTKQVKRAAAVNSGRKSDILPPVLLVVALLRPSVGDLIFIRVCGVWSGAVAIANNLADYRMHIERKKKREKKNSTHSKKPPGYIWHGCAATVAQVILVIPNGIYLV